MKKTFKRFLSGALATVMAVAGMAIGMTTSAYAADQAYGTVTVESTQVKSWDFTTNMPSGSNVNLKAGDTVNGITFTAVPKTNLNKSGYLSAGIGTVFTVPVPANSTGTIYVKATSGNSGRNVSFTDGTETKTMIMNTGTTNNSATFTAAATSSGVITLTAAGGECKIGLIQITLDEGFTFDSDTPIVTYNWSLDTSALVNVDPAGLALGNATTTSLTNTLTYTGANFDLKPEYATLTGVADADNNVVIKPTDDWFTAVTPKTYVPVEPTVTGNTSVYDFTTAGDNYLVSVNDATKSDTTAYTDMSTTGTDKDCYVELSASGAKLCDDSATDAVKLTVPCVATSGKVTISGSVTPTNNTGGKWKLVDLGHVAVTTDSAKNVTLTTDNQSVAATHAGAIAKNQTVTYSVTVDLDAKTASGTITNGTTTTDFADIALAADASVSKIVFSSNNSGNITGGNDRALVIPSVTIVKETAAPSVVITKTTNSAVPAVLSNGNTHYVVSIVSKAAATAATQLVQKSATNQTIATTDTVYTGLNIDGTVYTATDFSDSAAADDYVFASIINNDNSTDTAVVIANIQTLVSETN